MSLLNDKTILVTGASSGIGQVLAIGLSLAGANVIIHGRNAHKIEHTFSLLHGNGHASVVGDLTSVDELGKIVSELPALHGVVFNAGKVEYTPVKFLNTEKYNDVFDVNFRSNVLLTQLLLKGKKVQKQGSLVYIASISSKLGVPGTAMYAASKAALVAFVKVLASEVAPQGIRANSICPGIIKTPMTEIAAVATSSENMDNAEKEYPLGYGAPDDLNGVVQYLLSDNSKWMTGSDLIIDGGFLLK